MSYPRFLTYRSPVSRQLAFPAYSFRQLAPHTRLVGTKWSRYSPCNGGPVKKKEAGSLRWDSPPACPAVLRVMQEAKRPCSPPLASSKLSSLAPAMLSSLLCDAVGD
ncbi:hypothetical protein CapIbe_018492 [Capra ibex]